MVFFIKRNSNLLLLLFLLFNIAFGNVLLIHFVPDVRAGGGIPEPPSVSSPKFETGLVSVLGIQPEWPAGANVRVLELGSRQVRGVTKIIDGLVFAIIQAEIGEKVAMLDPVEELGVWHDLQVKMKTTVNEIKSRAAVKAEDIKKQAQIRLETAKNSVESRVEGAKSQMKTGISKYTSSEDPEYPIPSCAPDDTEDPKGVSSPVPATSQMPPIKDERLTITYFIEENEGELPRPKLLVVGERYLSRRIGGFCRVCSCT